MHDRIRTLDLTITRRVLSCCATTAARITSKTHLQVEDPVGVLDDGAGIASEEELDVDAL